MMSELMMDSKAGLRKLGPARGLLAAEAEASVDLWFGYDVHYHSRPVQRGYGSFAPRYVGSRNQVLGGLYFQQVHAQHMLPAGSCALPGPCNLWLKLSCIAATNTCCINCCFVLLFSVASVLHC